MGKIHHVLPRGPFISLLTLLFISSALSGCGPVTAVALLQNNRDLLGLVRRDNGPQDALATPQKKQDDKDANHDP